ncbi:UNVERIFIED_CONTAM: CASP-like protein 2D1 [Sesamum indicum]
MGFLDADVPRLKILDFSIRLLLVPFNLVAIWIAVNNRENNIDYGELEFADFIGLKYMVCISAVSAGYALFAAVSSWIRCLVTRAWIFFVADQNELALEPGTGILNGDISSYTSGVSLLGLQWGPSGFMEPSLCFLWEVLQVFRRYDPPFVSSKEGEQAAAT